MPKKFRFALQPVLDHRQRIEDEKQQTLAIRRLAHDEAKRELDRLNEEFRKHSLELRLRHRDLLAEELRAAGLGDASFMQGDIAGARKQYEEAFRLAREAHRDDRAAEIQTALAVVAREEKRFADGESLVRSAIVTFDKDNSVENTVWARAVLARIFLAQIGAHTHVA